MKTILKSLIVLIAIPFIILALVIGIFGSFETIRRFMSYDWVYVSRYDKTIAKMVEGALMHSYYEKETNSLPVVSSVSFDAKFKNIKYVCSANTLYSTPAPEFLELYGVKEIYAYGIEGKKRNLYGDGTSVLVLINENQKAIPIYFDYSAVKTDYKLKKLDDGCMSTKNDELIIKIIRVSGNETMMTLE